MPTDLGQATLVAQLPDTSLAALKADAAQALMVDDVTARASLVSILSALLAQATLAQTQPVSATSLPLPTGAATQTTLASILTALASVAVTGPLTETQLRATPVLVSGTVLTGQTQPLTDAQLRASKVGVADDYQAGEVLADQMGAGAVLTFTFATARNLVLIEAVGTSQIARADPFGGTPSATQGVRCDDATPTYLPVTTTVVKVFAPAGMVVSVAGFSRT